MSPQAKLCLDSRFRELAKSTQRGAGIADVPMSGLKSGMNSQIICFQLKSEIFIGGQLLFFCSKFLENDIERISRDRCVMFEWQVIIFPRRLAAERVWVQSNGRGEGGVK